MKKRRLIQHQKGFTLIEMMIVLVIISILLLVFIPNLTKNQEVASGKGCEATLDLANAQLLAYEIDHGTKASSIDSLVPTYMERATCPDGSDIRLVNGMAQTSGEN
ncbi:prepilin-type N-terminal cleavage/methylation domain-containing protein [Paenalkalicoccus suaedae]|uniref:ComG operon protein 3 n=1 Tax=Paenalkalicoccus suaedae TaxID=2592382 RepID=A0A859FCH0_9BACI|nr:competence type IV pilus major pilin ComGC [Paenalkalicoccus suaedae]QKS70929.1 prepilin-type N-terminal cleavage/methylation domain-containing protein [Paenalkalicoccus suaedae]